MESKDYFLRIIPTLRLNTNLVWWIYASIKKEKHIQNNSK